MSVKTNSAPSFFFSSLKKVKNPTFTERAMEAFLNRNIVQFTDFLAKAQNAGENLNAICRNNGETLPTALAKYVNPPYMNIAKGYNLNWSAKNSYNETVEYIKSCHAKNPAQKAILESFFTALEKAKTTEQQAVVNTQQNVEAAKIAIEIPKEQAKVAYTPSQKIFAKIEKIADPKVVAALKEYQDALKSAIFTDSGVVINKKFIAISEKNLMVALQEAGATEVLELIKEYRDKALNANEDFPLATLEKITDPKVVAAVRECQAAIKSEDTIEEELRTAEGERKTSLEAALISAEELVNTTGKNLMVALQEAGATEVLELIKEFNNPPFSYTIQVEGPTTTYITTEEAKESAVVVDKKAEVANKEADKAVEKAVGAVVNAESKATEAEAAQEQAVDAVVNAESKATEAEAADMLIPAVVEPTDTQVAGEITEQTPTDIMDHMRDFGGF